MDEDCTHGSKCTYTVRYVSTIVGLETLLRAQVVKVTKNIYQGQTISNSVPPKLIVTLVLF